MVNIIAGLLKNNIVSLNIPSVLKGALKKLKSLFIPQTKDTEEGKTGEAEPEMARTQMRPRRPVGSAGMGENNNDRIRIRNRRYKIK